MIRCKECNRCFRQKCNNATGSLISETMREGKCSSKAVEHAKKENTTKVAAYKKKEGLCKKTPCHLLLLPKNFTLESV